MSNKLAATHGTVYSLEKDYFGYFGWPSVARTFDGTLFAAASGLRNAHVCPFGRTTLFISRDEGATWSSPRIINDSPFDDRDAGIVSLPDGTLLLSWFTSDNRDTMLERIEDDEHEEANASWRNGIAWMTDEQSDSFCGAWIRTSQDNGGTWQPPARVPLNTPHGPIVLQDESLLYFGKNFGIDPSESGMRIGQIMAMQSRDAGATWNMLGTVPPFPGTEYLNYHEPHVVELPDGRLIGHIRVQNYGDSNVTDVGIPTFSIMQSQSDNGGESWSEMRSLGFHGSPPHLLLHSSGTLICTYGCREEPYGQRVALSHDKGVTWKHDYILRDDGPDSDLGYPCSIELDDGQVYTVYYQKLAPGENCSLLWSRWELP